MHLFGAKAAKPKAKTEAAASSGPIIDGGIETFAQDVIQASMTVPVLVDFWAPWCGPCKQLTPVLEKVVKAANGKVRLVKINIDENPELAQQLRIQSVPTVYAFVGGQPVTGFAGAQPESQIKALIDKLVGAGGANEPIGQDIEAAKAAAQQGDLDTAAGIYDAILQEDPANAEAIGGLSRLLLSTGQLDEAQELLDGTPKEQQGHIEVTGAKAALALARESGDLGDPGALAARLGSAPDDHDARYKLATISFLRGEAEEAMRQLCLIVKSDRTWNEDAARKQLVRFFEALGPKDPATLKGRRMLSAVLFS